MQAELRFEKTRNAALNFEVARLKRWRFGSSSESLEASTQAVLFDAILADTLLEDIAAQQAAKPAASAPPVKRQAVRQALPASLPRIEHHHELEQTHCACGEALERIGEEVSEQLDRVPAQFGVRLAPLVAALKTYILGHGVIHVDETPVALLAPGKGKTKKAYVWVYRTTDFVSCNGKGRAVFYDFCKDRSGEHPRRVLGDFSATLVTDDYAGYHGLHRSGVTAALCWAHARRKLFEAHEHTGSEIAGQAVALIAQLYEIERELRDIAPQERRLRRQQDSKPTVRRPVDPLARHRFRRADARVRPAVAWFLVGATGFGLSLRFYLLAQRAFGAARTGSVFAFAPFVGAVFALCLGEQPGGAWMVGGAALMIAGIVLHLAERHSHEHEHPLMAHEHAHAHDDGHHGHAHSRGNVAPPLSLIPAGDGRLRPALGRSEVPAEMHSHAHRHLPIRHSHTHVPDEHHMHRH